MSRHDHGMVRNNVRTILENVPAARASYDVLYVEFVKSVDPVLIEKPFYMTMTNTELASYQCVARSSRHVKKACPWLKETKENRKHRDQIEQEYFLEYGKR